MAERYEVALVAPRDGFRRPRVLLAETAVGKVSASDVARWFLGRAESPAYPAGTYVVIRPDRRGR